MRESGAASHSFAEDRASLEALRFVFAVVLEREVAAACMDVDVDEAITLWPSSLYGMLAAAAVRSPAVWRRCAGIVDDRFGDALARQGCASPATLAQLFVDGRDVLTTYELAGLLWVLLRRQDAELAFGEARLRAEMAVVAAGRAQALDAGWLDGSTGSLAEGREETAVGAHPGAGLGYQDEVVCMWPELFLR